MADEITLAQPYLDRNVRHPSDTLPGGQPPHAYKLLASYARGLEEAIDNIDGSVHGEHARQAAAGFIGLMEKMFTLVKGDLRAPAIALETAEAHPKEKKPAKTWSVSTTSQLALAILTAMQAGPKTLSEISESLTPDLGELERKRHMCSVRTRLYALITAGQVRSYANPRTKNYGSRSKSFELCGARNE